MNQLCKVCGEPAAGFHFGAFTCEGCKSFFGRTYNNISAIAGCKNNGDCVINKKNRTACKACRLRKCLLVGMSKSGSRYGRRSNWFKIHCLLQEQQQQAQSHQQISSNFDQLQHLHQQMHARQTYQDKTNPSIKTVQFSPPSHHLYATSPAPQFIMNGISNISQTKSEPRLSSPSDSAHSFADHEDEDRQHPISPSLDDKTFFKSIRSSSEPLKLFSPLSTTKLSPFVAFPAFGVAPIPTTLLAACQTVQEEPIDLSINSRNRCRTETPPAPAFDLPKPAPLDLTLVRSHPMSG